ncbi:hypothetical protein AX16_007852 [Volvariella volvacea WC 439]|nr:hypothetical protein AX16_007852 [Volvariella volvacea WC 439]
MVKLTAISLALASLIATAAGHAVVTVPTPRKIGSANQAACGTPVYNVLKSDIRGPIENAAAKIDSSYNAAACHLFFCRGLQWGDNTSNTRVYKAGSTVSFHVDIAAHHTGYANVTIYSTATQRAIAPALKTWPVYADDTIPPWEWPPDESDFTVTIPDLGTQCSQPGACVIQWWWWGYNRQTYESCVDFTQ